jgi:hypothetical protein
MNCKSEKKTKCSWSKLSFCLMMWLSLVLLPQFSKAVLAAENENLQHYKMISTVEYTGKGQFRNQAETIFTVRKQPLPDDKVRHCLSANNFDLAGDGLNSEQQPFSKDLSFIIDRKTRQLSGVDENLALWAKINNECVNSLRKVTKKDVGKTWKQSFNLSSLGEALPGELKFTVTAIQVKTQVFDEMIAVRALSEPFVVKAAKGKGDVGPVLSRVNAIYIFDPEIEDIYVSISVFEATTNINGPEEKLRREVVTYRTDAMGVPADFSGLGRNFERFVRKVGLHRKSLKVDKASPLPQWALSEGIHAAQLTNMYAAMACEGAFNPVVTVCIPAARVVEMQCFGGLVSADELESVSALLAKSVPGMGTLNIAAAPAFMGAGLGTAGVIAGGTVGAIAIADGGSSSSSARSASTP